mmetsp:Transcript_52650/g.58871  ORF Transcript_52650/g.58871 Transcript_52650/m.58871 type:complete len:310 (+) Transcript_52650:155-1084(+)
MSSDQSSLEPSKITAKTSSAEHLEHKDDGERIETGKGGNDDRDENPLSKRAKVDLSGNEICPLKPANNNNTNSSKGTLLLPSNSNNIKVNDDGNSNNNASDSDTATLRRGNSGEIGETRLTTTIADTTTQGLFPPSVIPSRDNFSDRDEVKDKTQEPNKNDSNLDPKSVNSQVRWRVHQMAEDYVNFVGKIMYPATQFQPYGYNAQQREYPIEKVSMIGFLKSPLRRPSILERWSPYEIAIFEGSMLHYGKEFREISSQIGTKSTREVIDFYYIWKKTDHYKKWKETFISDEDLLDEYNVQPPVKKPKR